MKNQFDIVVVGGGHAGCEAALAAARMGMQTALVTMRKSEVARLSCNPAIGGIAKSHIVCEVDALGGEIARNADYTGIQFRTLNTRKGAAVQAHRIQSDKEAYPARMSCVLDQQQHLGVLEGLATRVTHENGRLTGIELHSGEMINARAVILTPGTFLNGTIHIGRRIIPAGRWGDNPAEELGANLRTLGFRLERLKTGTPPRLHKDSLHYERMELQPGMVPPPLLSRQARKEWQMFHVEQAGQLDTRETMFHLEHHPSPLSPWPVGSNQLPCYLTHTNERTHEIIAQNLKESALYGGEITGTGVRYCPSIEDKVVKFTSRQQHHVFIEPEGRLSDRIYPNGTSNSLPEHIQLEMIHSIVGLEDAVFIRPGYGIEYDFVDPTQLSRVLEAKAVEHLYFAGQINGTTGYEEAAGQGLIAGINAVLKLRGEPPLELSRSEAYIGVMIDDLVTKGTDEPYRMFTSRAEHRLALRQSNAAFRLVDHAVRLRLLPETTCAEVARERQQVEEEVSRVGTLRIDGASARSLLHENAMRYTDLPAIPSGLSDELALEIETRLKYDGYIARENERIARSSKLERQRIPVDLDYDSIRALRFEAREKLKRVRPTSIGQAARISGVNPPDLSILSVWISKLSQERKELTGHELQD